MQAYDMTASLFFLLANLTPWADGLYKGAESSKSSSVLNLFPGLSPGGVIATTIIPAECHLKLRIAL